MRLIKYTHACVRIEHEDHALVIDPGVWSEHEALVGVSDVLITHEHFDHVDAARLASALTTNHTMKIHAPASVAMELSEHAGDLADAIAIIAVGDEFTAAGLSVKVVGGEHAEIYDGLPGCPNVGFIVDNNVYHPGDALFVPETQVQTLLVPTAAPWLKIAEVLDFVRAVAPERAHSIHDAMLSKIGEEGVDRWLSWKGNTDYSRIPIGGSVKV